MPVSCLPLPFSAFPPPLPLCTDKGPAWITFKAIWQRPKDCLGPKLQRQFLACYPLTSGPLGTWGLQLVILVLSLTLNALQRLWKLAWQKKLSGASFLQASLSLLPLRGRYSNTEGLGRGSSEPQAPGTESRSSRQTHYQGHNTEGKEPQSLATESRLDKPTWNEGVTSHQTA